MTGFVEIVEVGPRDGLQNEKTSLGVADRLTLIGRLESAGARRIEAVSFVNPARVPQMAGAEAIMDALPAAKGVSRIGLVLNRRGWDRALAAGCDEANIVVTATDGFGIRNQGASVAYQMAALAGMTGQVRRTLSIAVAFGCPFDGEVEAAALAELSAEAQRLGIEEIALADTIGAADPWTVRRKIEAVRKAAPDTPLRLHFHNTRNTGLANAFAAVEAGVRVLDASVGGLGGCPFAPGATGNVATEDLAWMLERAGFETGYDVGALLDTARWVCGLLGKAPDSGVAKAGVF